MACVLSRTLAGQVWCSTPGEAAIYLVWSMTEMLLLMKWWGTSWIINGLEAYIEITPTNFEGLCGVSWYDRKYSIISGSGEELISMYKGLTKHEKMSDTRTFINSLTALHVACHVTWIRRSSSNICHVCALLLLMVVCTTVRGSRPPNHVHCDHILGERR